MLQIRALGAGIIVLLGHWPDQKNTDYSGKKLADILSTSG